LLGRKRDPCEIQRALAEVPASPLFAEQGIGCKGHIAQLDGCQSPRLIHRREPGTLHPLRVARHQEQAHAVGALAVLQSCRDDEKVGGVSV
jgi:hypothetical protein